MDKEYDNVIEARQLAVGYAKRAVVSGMDFTVRRGEITALIGENGSGKSTLLKTLTGELPVISGNVYIEGREIGSLTAKDMAKSAAIVMTRASRPDFFTCRDMVSSGRYPYTGRLGGLTAKDEAAVDEAMRLTGTSELADR